MKLIDWQFNRKWHLSYKYNKYEYQDTGWWEYWIIIGPLQTRWWGKLWPKLYRTPQWSARMQEILKEDLESTKYCQTLIH